MVFCVHRTFFFYDETEVEFWSLTIFGFDQIDELSVETKKCVIFFQIIKWMKRLFVLELNCHFSCPPDSMRNSRFFFFVFVFETLSISLFFLQEKKQQQKLSCVGKLLSLNSPSTLFHFKFNWIGSEAKITSIRTISEAKTICWAKIVIFLSFWLCF